MSSVDWPAGAAASGVSGPVSATTNAIAKFSDSSGDNIVGTGIIVDASDNVSGMGTLGCGAITSSGDIGGVNLTASGTITSTGNVNGASPTEMGYLSGVTSAIQTQLDAMVEKAGDTMTGLLTLSGDPSTALQAATKQYVDAAIDGVKRKTHARAATTANITLSGTQTIDGISLIAGDRCLVKDQSTDSENGIYEVAAGAWSRTSDANSAGELNNALVSVAEGTSNGNTGWYQSAEITTLGSDSVTWVQNFGAGTFVADESTLTLSGSTFSVASGGITATQLASNIAINTTATGHSFGIASGDGNFHIHKGTAGAVTANTIADELVVESDETGGHGISILGPDNGVPALIFGSPSDNDWGQVYGSYNSGDPYISLWINGGERVRFDDDTVNFQNGNLTTGGTITCTNTSGISIDSAATAATVDDLLTIERTIGAAGTSGMGIKFNHNNGTDMGAIYSTYSSSNTDLRGALEFWTGYNTAFAQAMTIDANQNVGIGTTSPDDILHLEGNAPALRLYDTGASAYWRIIADTAGSAEGLYFNDGTATRMLINDDGNVGIGTTSPAYSLVIDYATSDNHAFMIQGDTNASTSEDYIRLNRDDGNAVGYIRGDCLNRTIALANGSDRRIKRNIEPMPSILDKVRQVELMAYDLVGGGKSHGAIAQQLIDVFPDKVTATDDGLGDEMPKNVEPWSVRHDWHWELMKCVQELAAKVEALEARA